MKKTTTEDGIQKTVISFPRAGGKTTRGRALQSLAKVGDKQGHPFRGNQYQSASGGDVDAGGEGDEESSWDERHEANFPGGSKHPTGTHVETPEEHRQRTGHDTPTYSGVGSPLFGTHYTGPNGEAVKITPDTPTKDLMESAARFTTPVLREYSKEFKNRYSEFQGSRWRDAIDTELIERREKKAFAAQTKQIKETKLANEAARDRDAKGMVTHQKNALEALDDAALRRFSIQAQLGQGKFSLAEIRAEQKRRRTKRKKGALGGIPGLYS